MADEEISVGEAAASRRERLRALRMAQELLNTPDEDASQDQNKDDQTADDESVNVKFRNYLPQDKQLQEGKLAPPDLPKFEDPVAAAPIVEKKQEEDPFLSIAPKKPNWDLKRDVQKKLDKLDRRTQKALYKLMEEQQRLENGGTAEIED